MDESDGNFSIWHKLTIAVFIVPLLLVLIGAVLRWFLGFASAIPG